MPRIAKKLTKRDLDGLRSQAEADPNFDKILADGGAPGLYVRARRGAVHFYTRYRPPGGGRRRTMKLKRYGAITLDQARKIALGRSFQEAQGHDPAEVAAGKKRDRVTVRGAVEAYLASFADRVEKGDRKASSLGSARDRLERHVLPRIGSRRVRDVTPADIRRLHQAITTPTEANRTLSALSPVFTWARHEGVVQENPCARVHVAPFKENGRRRAVTAEELERLGQVLQEAERTGGVMLQKGAQEPKRYRIHPSLVLAVRLLGLTGMRAAEVLGHGTKSRRGDREGLRWGDVDLDAGLIHLHDSKTGRQTRVVGAAVVELLRGAKPKDAAEVDPVCPGERAGQPLVGTGRPRRYLWQAAGIEETAAGRADLHSLRHSYASIGAHLHHGRYAGLVAPLLGHSSQQRAVTARYIHDDTEALKFAADAIAGEIGRLLGLGEGGEVIEFPARKAGDGSS